MKKKAIIIQVYIVVFLDLFEVNDQRKKKKRENAVIETSRIYIKRQLGGLTLSQGGNRV
jgi:hypothetical protein